MNGDMFAMLSWLEPHPNDGASLRQYCIDRGVNWHASQSLDPGVMGLLSYGDHGTSVFVRSSIMQSFGIHVGLHLIGHWIDHIATSSSDLIVTYEDGKLCGDGLDENFANRFAVRLAGHFDTV